MLYCKLIKSSIVDSWHRFEDLTCVAVSHLACFSESEAMRTEVEKEVAVVRKRPEPQVDEVTELVHRFDVRVRSTERRTYGEPSTAAFLPPVIHVKQKTHGSRV